MKRSLLFLMCLVALVSQARVTCPVNARDIINMIDFSPLIPEATGEQDAEAFMDNAKSIFLNCGFKQGLTGEGYGGPCVIIDGFYKGGYSDEQTYSFVPTNEDVACVIEVAACNNGEDSDYEVFVTMDLYSQSNAENFIKELAGLGFEVVSYEENGKIRSFCDGTYVVDYAHEEEYAYDMHCFRIQTLARKTKFE